MPELIGIGLQLTIWGMGLVFLLLALLWGLMTILLRLDKTQAEAMPDKTHATVPAGPAPDVLAAITIAVMMHRRVRRKEAAPAMRTHQPGTLPSRWVSTGRTRQNQTWQPRQR
jgi:Na+-transporting methylmalonyl-CoA/oxaloacetate decarboxylase gamma subunit